MHKDNPRITASGYAGFGIKPSFLRPVYVGFMHVWAGITGVGGDFVHERFLSRKKRGKEALGTAVLVSAS
jgi:hypothetical protein